MISGIGMTEEEVYPEQMNILNASDLFSTGQVIIRIPSWSKYGELVDNESVYPLMQELLSKIREVNIHMSTDSEKGFEEVMAAEYCRLGFVQPEGWSEIGQFVLMPRSTILQGEEWEQFITSPPYIQNFGVAAGIVAANMSNDENNLVNFSCCMEVFIYANAPEDTTEGFVGLNQICFESVCGVAVSDFCKCN